MSGEAGPMDEDELVFNDYNRNYPIDKLYKVNENKELFLVNDSEFTITCEVSYKNDFNLDIITPVKAFNELVEINQLVEIGKGLGVPFRNSYGLELMAVDLNLGAYIVARVRRVKASINNAEDTYIANSMRPVLTEQGSNKPIVVDRDGVILTFNSNNKSYFVYNSDNNDIEMRNSNLEPIKISVLWGNFEIDHITSIPFRYRKEGNPFDPPDEPTVLAIAGGGSAGMLPLPPQVNTRSGNMNNVDNAIGKINNYNKIIDEQIKIYKDVVLKEIINKLNKTSKELIDAISKVKNKIKTKRENGAAEVRKLRELFDLEIKLNNLRSKYIEHMTKYAELIENERNALETIKGKFTRIRSKTRSGRGTSDLQFRAVVGEMMLSLSSSSDKYIERVNKINQIIEKINNNLLLFSQGTIVTKTSKSKLSDYAESISKIVKDETQDDELIAIIDDLIKNLDISPDLEGIKLIKTVKID